MSVFNCKTNIPTSGQTVQTISNDGTVPGGVYKGKTWNYSNQCFWISILEGLNKLNIPNKPQDVPNLRANIKKMVGVDNINKGDELFDTQKYYDCLTGLTHKYEIKLNIYEVHKKSLIRKLWTIGDEYDNVVNIAFFGNHFEYIVQIDNNFSCSSYSSSSSSSSSRSSQRLSINKERIKYFSKNNKVFNSSYGFNSNSKSLMDPSIWN